MRALSGIARNVSSSRHTMSTIFRPTNIVPVNIANNQNPKKPTIKSVEAEPLSKSLKLMIDNGLIRSSATNGMYYLLPMAQKSLDKLISVVDLYMAKAGCQKLKMPCLTSSKLWKASGRLEDTKSELFQTTDRHSKEYILSPTHEESICDLLSSLYLTYRQLPLRLYQITDKYRDEIKPRFGLMRSREFLMKDLYTFDADAEAARKTYDEIVLVYEKLFTHLGVKWVKASASSGIMGGTLSHEFLFPSEVGEDIIVTCSQCNEAFNQEIIQIQNVVKHQAVANNLSHSVVDSEVQACPNCQSQQLQTSKAIEVGHTFLLGQKYTKPLRAKFVNDKGQPSIMDMGCYGFGVSRVFAAAIEVMSTWDEIRWPKVIAPYLVLILPPKAGSKEESRGKPLADKIYETLNGFIPNDVLLDDRTNLTIGKRILEGKKLGIPYLVIYGKAIKENVPMVEVYNVNTGLVTNMLEKDLPNFFYDIKSRLNSGVST